MRRWGLVGILVLAAVLRFYRLGQVPYGLAWDEAAFAYNGWSISLWNRDEFANFLPLVFKSYGDYKPPLFVYLLAGYYKIFGFNEQLVRVYSALAGIVSVMGMFLLAKELFPKKRWLSLLAAFLTGISPWAIHFSRIGFEANIALPFVIYGAWLLLLGRRWKLAWPLAALVLGLSLYLFHNAKIVVPVLLLGFGFSYRSSPVVFSRRALVSLILLVLLALPIAYTTVYKGLGERGRQTLIFFRENKRQSTPKITSELVRNVGNQWSLDFWIRGKDVHSPRHAASGFGVLYRIELPFLIVGLVALLLGRRKEQLVLWWLVAGFLPAFVTHGVPHTVRSLLALPAVVMLVAIGVDYSVVFLAKHGRHLWLKVGSVGWVIILTLELMVYLRYYYTSYAQMSATAFQYGYKEVFAEVVKRQKSVDKIVFTDAYGQPYIYALIYQRIEPQQFLFGALNQYEFHAVGWPTTQLNRLFVATPEEISPTDPAVVETVKVPGSDQVVWVIAET
ncbi:hypothetical protein A3A66_00590 [Microgenomates group bacterium RIFCSPLOWO2_01_FULL_46_13]|nr:MAG: hypothetical protein A2783_04065 [Microgenomates group bacterium RIFCSPHIGHO2_01_FULL_45_11]OGV94509.1 MAG: hypothetical protein A3A66_00590 [Microgenomates group bacterium RIFCSPLOWO2_01_FULL_46_13]